MVGRCKHGKFSVVAKVSTRSAATTASTSVLRSGVASAASTMVPSNSIIGVELQVAKPVPVLVAKGGATQASATKQSDVLSFMGHLT